MSRLNYSLIFVQKLKRDIRQPRWRKYTCCMYTWMNKTQQHLIIYERKCLYKEQEIVFNRVLSTVR